MKTLHKNLKIYWKKWLIYAARLAVASSLAIYVADILKLQFSTQAGVICLFSMLTTSKDTLRLSVARLLSFGVTFAAAWIFFHHISSEWIAFGVYIFVTVIFSEIFGWGAALSANVVAGCHFLSVENFTTDIIVNEFYIVLTGMFFAILFNIFRDTDETKMLLDKNITAVQEKMQFVLDQMAEYLNTQAANPEVWVALDDLRQFIDKCIVEAAEYEGNCFDIDAKYYIEYFEMRRSQSDILFNLQEELKKVKYIPKQAEIIREYMKYLSAFVTEMNVPDQQIEHLDDIFRSMEEEALPTTRAEFESRAMLFHVLMDLQDFLTIKKRFVDSGAMSHIRATEGNMKLKWGCYLRK